MVSAYESKLRSETASATREVSVIDNTMSELRQGVCDLSLLVGQLVERIQPVMRPPVPQNAESGHPNAPPPVVSPLTNQINDVLVDLADIRRRVEFALNHVEV